VAAPSPRRRRQFGGEKHGRLGAQVPSRPRLRHSGSWRASHGRPHSGRGRPPTVSAASCFTLPASPYAYAGVRGTRCVCACKPCRAPTRTRSRHRLPADSAHAGEPAPEPCGHPTLEEERLERAGCSACQMQQLRSRDHSRRTRPLRRLRPRFSCRTAGQLRRLRPQGSRATSAGRHGPSPRRGRRETTGGNDAPPPPPSCRGSRANRSRPVRSRDSSDNQGGSAQTTRRRDWPIAALLRADQAWRAGAAPAALGRVPHAANLNGSPLDRPVQISAP